MSLKKYHGVDAPTYMELTLGRVECREDWPAVFAALTGAPCVSSVTFESGGTVTVRCPVLVDADLGALHTRIKSLVAPWIPACRAGNPTVPAAQAVG